MVTALAGFWVGGCDSHEPLHIVVLINGFPLDGDPCVCKERFHPEPEAHTTFPAHERKQKVG